MPDTIDMNLPVGDLADLKRKYRNHENWQKIIRGLINGTPEEKKAASRMLVSWWRIWKAPCAKENSRHELQQKDARRNKLR